MNLCRAVLVHSFAFFRFYSDEPLPFIDCQITRPDLFTYETRLEKTVNQNLSLAFHLATAEFATPRLLEPMDMHPDSVDARATAAYVMELRKAVERDRKRRSRGILEIQTTIMVSGVKISVRLWDDFPVNFLMSDNQNSCPWVMVFHTYNCVRVRMYVCL